MHLVTLGEILIDMFPSEIGLPLAEVTAFRPKPGGAPANVAVAAHRLGANTAFIGKVGDDIFGRKLINVLATEGVETRGMRYRQRGADDDGDHRHARRAYRRIRLLPQSGEPICGCAWMN